MAEQTADQEAELSVGGTEVASSGGKRKLMVIAAGAIGLLLITGAVLYFTGIVDKFVGHKEAAAEKPAAAAAPVAVFFDLPDLLVNLNTTGRKASFLKLSVSLELERADDLARLQAVMPRIIDNFQVYLRELRVEDLRGSSGIYRLREELLTRVNTAVAPIKVHDVLFKEMLVQ
jgi:flagellar protein FliL